MSDSDYVERHREYSPNDSMILISYCLDQGAFGHGNHSTAILKISDTIKDLRDFSVHSDLENLKWIDNQNISAEFDVLPAIRNGAQVNLKDHIVNGVKIKVTALDYIENGAQIRIEHKEASPNGQFELVAYRYVTDSHDLNNIHVSVIPTGHEIPKYGNYYIAPLQSDYILFGTWTKENKLKFYTNAQSSELIKHYMVNSKSKIDYIVAIDNKEYGDKYLWIQEKGK